MFKPAWHQILILNRNQQDDSQSLPLEDNKARMRRELLETSAMTKLENACKDKKEHVNYSKNSFFSWCACI